MTGERHARTLGSVPLLIAICCVSSSAFGEVIYVDDDAPDFGDGSSWENAYRFLQDGWRRAIVLGGPIEVRVAQGLYRPDRSIAEPNGSGDRDAFFPLLVSGTVRGGYAGVCTPDPNAWDPAAYETVLSGDLAGNDAELAAPLDARDDPTRAENCYHVVRGAGDAELIGVTVTGGHAFSYKEDDGHVTTSRHLGGGLKVTHHQYSTLRVTLRDCLFLGNFAEAYGGGISSLYGDIVMVRCRVTRNGAYQYGGGAAILNGKLTMTDCHISENIAVDHAGGVKTSEAEVAAFGCAFDGNVAEGVGGVAADRGPARFVDCVWTGNQAYESLAGALQLSNATIFESVQLSGCRFVGNRAAIGAGAILVGADTIAVNCLFAGNEAGVEGGALLRPWGGQIHLLSCTAAGNRAPKGQFLRDGVSNPSGFFATWVVHLDNCIISDGGNEIWNDLHGMLTIQNTCFAGGRGAVHDPCDMLVWGPGNMDTTPQFADPGYWDANGTPDDPTDDFFVVGDYHLKSQAGRWDPQAESWVMDDITSACIDAGDPNSPIGQEPFPNGGRINLGAYGGTTEASKSWFGEPPCETIIAGDINDDCRVDFKDLQILSLHWLESGDKARE